MQELQWKRTQFFKVQCSQGWGASLGSDKKWCNAGGSETCTDLKLYSSNLGSIQELHVRLEVRFAPFCSLPRIHITMTVFTLQWSRSPLGICGPEQQPTETLTPPPVIAVLRENNGTS